MSSIATFRDPIHGDIILRREIDQVVLDIIDTDEFQRMRRIRQLALASFVFHGAEHSRFTHLLGAFALMRRTLDRLAEYGDDRTRRVIGEYRRTAEIAALLHDIGHGPFSHSFETVFTSQNHEETGHQLILGGSSIHDALVRHGIHPQDVVAMQTGDGPHPFFTQLVSSQLDCDRMDYLLRDAYMTGARAGTFDLERLLNALTVVDEEGRLTLAVREKGIPVVEGFLIARGFMHQGVYHHKMIESAEHMLQMILRRATELAQAGQLTIEYPALAAALLEHRIDLQLFPQLDDTAVISSIQRWQDHADPILRDFSRRFLSRHLLKAIKLDAPLGVAMRAKIEALAQSAGFDPAYYLAERSWTLEMLPAAKKPTDAVRVLTREGVVAFESVSKLIAAMDRVQDSRALLIAPEEIRAGIYSIIRR